MRKILIRSSMPFDEEKNVSEILLSNLIGDNTGNLIFQNSVARTVMTEDTEITMIKTAKTYTDEEVDYYNENYDMFLIPLANALRNSFRRELVKMTSFIKRLKIPCVVIGIGIQRDINSKNWKYAFDEEADEFFKAILEKSSCIGLRGEITAEYMKRRGFVPEKDFTVIGCPSMYMYGDSLPVPELKELTPQSKVSYNFKETLPDILYKFIRREAGKFDDSTFITQVINEIKTVYVGYPYESLGKKKVPDDYPVYLSSEMMRTGKIVGVVDLNSWLDFLRTRDFNFGSRIHGNIASILAGTPCYIFAGDSRVEELAGFHHIPHLSYRQITEDTDIFSLYEKTDYGCLMEGHKDRVTHYLDFLDRNGVERIERETLNGKNAPYDLWNTQKKSIDILYPFPYVSLGEKGHRLKEYFHEKNRQIKSEPEKKYSFSQIKKIITGRK